MTIQIQEKQTPLELTSHDNDYAHLESAQSVNLPDFLVKIQNNEIIWSNLPRIIVDPQGLGSLAASAPVFPATNSIALPSSFPDQIEPIDAVTSTFTNLFAGKTIAIAASANTEAHSVARVALTLIRSGASVTAVAGVNNQHILRLIPVELSKS